MKVKDIYKEHDERTIRYMENVITDLEQQYTNVPSSWRVSLDLIADTLDIYFKSVDDINKRGLFVYDDKNRPSKNQACAIQNVCLQNIVKLLNNFGCTAMSAKKLATLDTEENTLQDLLSC